MCFIWQDLEEQACIDLTNSAPIAINDFQNIFVWTTLCWNVQIILLLFESYNPNIFVTWSPSIVIHKRKENGQRYEKRILFLHTCRKIKIVCGQWKATNIKTGNINWMEVLQLDSLWGSGIETPWILRVGLLCNTYKHINPYITPQSLCMAVYLTEDTSMSLNWVLYMNMPLATIPATFTSCKTCVAFNNIPNVTKLPKFKRQPQNYKYIIHNHIQVLIECNIYRIPVNRIVALWNWNLFDIPVNDTE